MNSELRIRTPEGIVFSYALAGPVARCLACAADIFIVAAIEQVAVMLIRLAGLLFSDIAAGLGMVAFFVISIGYSMAFEWLAREIGRAHV